MTPAASAHLFLPEDASLPTRLRVAWRSLKILHKEVDHPVAGPALLKSLDHESYARLAPELAKTDDGRALLAERPALQGSALDLPALARLPEGTLGAEFARFLSSRGLKPFDSPFEVRNDAEFLAKRFRDTHDLVHVLTGYGTDELGEMEVQAFYLGNMGTRTAALLLVYSLVHVLPNLELSTPQYLRRLRDAWRRGRRTRPVIRPRYESYWDRPVDEVRALLELPPLTALR
ncbi:MAG: Coq4 family protein [Myxococcota bacterium]